MNAIQETELDGVKDSTKYVIQIMIMILVMSLVSLINALQEHTQEQENALKKEALKKVKVTENKF